MRDFVKAGEESVAADVAKAFIAALQQAPDALVADALENAVRWKWLGRFECRRDAAPWTATISFSKGSTDREELRLPGCLTQDRVGAALTGHPDRKEGNPLGADLQQSHVG
jgi:hypothetical protein